MKTSRQRVLIVEDEAIVAMMEARAITSRGYAVDRASTGEEAISLYGDGEGYDMMVTDIDVGSGIDGIETARRILAIRPVPLVIMTSHKKDDVDIQASELGRYEYIEKGYGNEELLSAIERALTTFHGVA
jgi:CheY-like chemotaxis protein